MKLNEIGNKTQSTKIERKFKKRGLNIMKDLSNYKFSAP